MFKKKSPSTSIRLLSEYSRRTTPWYFTVAATIIISAFCVFVDYTYTKTTISPLLMDSSFILTLRALTIAVLLDYTPLPLSYIIHKPREQCEKKPMLIACLLLAWFGTFLSYLFIAYSTRMALMSSTAALSGMYTTISSEDKFKAFALFINSGITPACTSLLSFTVAYMTYDPKVQERFARASLVSKAKLERAATAAAMATASELLEEKNLDLLKDCLDARTEVETREILARGEELRSMNGYVINDHLSRNPDPRCRQWATVTEAVTAEHNAAVHPSNSKNKIQQFPAAH